MIYRWIRNLFRVGNSTHLARAAKLALRLQSLVLSLIFASYAGAIPTPPGTIISNIANSSQQVGPALQSAATNAVIVTVGSIPLAGAPTLTKAFGAASINQGGTTTLAFTLSNVAGNPAQAGIAFNDTLPAGLKFSPGATAAISGAGCTGTVNLTAPGTVAASSIAMTAGTASCSVVVSSVTNVVGQLNASCAANPASFTNASANIGGLANLTNAVTPQCLSVVAPILPPSGPTLTKSFGAAAISPGSSTQLIFTIENGNAVSAQAGIAFTDTLPAGLRFAPGATATVSGIGCTGTVSLTAPGTVNASSIAITSGTAFCSVIVSFVTNVPGQLNTSCAANPAAFTNTSANLSGVANVTNAVTPQCLVVAIPIYPPTLTKVFNATEIVDGDSTSLTFTLTSTPGNPGQAGITFYDMLPPGLALKSGAIGQIDAGCVGNVNLLAPNVIAVTNLTIMTGIASCNITVSGITNRNGATNPSQCGATNDPSFTNDASSISNLVTVVNAVTPQCLKVLPPQPALTKQFAAIHIADGDSTRLTFFVNNSPAMPAVSAVAFTDTLPPGLQLASNASFSLQGAGCNGQVSLAAPSRISVTGLSMSAGTQFCTLVIDGITNVAGQLNASCAALPASFTNSASSISGLAGVFNAVQPSCLAVDPVDPALKSLSVTKSISAASGASPSSAYTVRLSFKNTSSAVNAVKQDMSIVDALPAGMNYVPGSLKLTSGGSTIPMINSGGVYTLGTRNGVYDTTGNTITVSLSTLFPAEQGEISFDVAISAGLALNTVLQNTAQFSYTDSRLSHVGPKNSNTVEFRISDTVGVTLRGMTIASVEPGSTVVFENILSNTGSKTDTFDITLSGAIFPVGTVIRMFKDDGITPLADTNGNGIADTGPVAPGGTYKIVVTAALPLGIAGGPYRVRKNAQSITNSQVRAADDDIVSAISHTCRVALEPDNSGQVAPGGSIVYSHTVTNTGVCDETITFPANLLANLAAGWTAQLFLDNPLAGGQSIVGVLDPADAQLSTGSSFPLAPGARAILLVKVTAPAAATNGASNTTELRVVGGASGALLVRDVTVVGTATNVNNVIQGYIDNTFQRPTVWATISKDFYLKANAPACISDPTIIEHRTIIITGPNGEHEELTATETAAGSGIFIVEGIPVRRPPVTSGDGILEGNPYDTFDVEIIGCSRKITTTVTLVDPNGVVFDSVSNQPVAGATVRLVTVQGGQCTTTPAPVSQLQSGRVVAAPNPVITGSDGRFDYPLVTAADYCVLVTTPNGYTWKSKVPANLLPAGRNILATGPTTGGSYGGAFHVGPETGPVILDVPVDAGKIAGLFVQKAALRPVVEIGEFNDYLVTIHNGTGYDLNQADVLATDSLPMGFTYVAGTARLDGKPLADPAGKGGPQLVFNVGHLAKDQEVKLTYRIRVGPGALQGDGINRIFASYRTGGSTSQYSESNLAMVQVTVNAGVFSDKGFITGKIYADCNRDRVQDEHEVGVPGIRLYLEDGTNVVSDAEGKFSFYGITPRTHVLKIDRQSLPVGITVRDLIDLSSRNLGKGDSQVVDLQSGELHKANFAIQSCTEPVMAEIAQRRLSAASMKTEVEGRLQQKLSTDTVVKANADLKALPATGVVSGNGTAVGPQGTNSGNDAAPAIAATSGFQTLTPAPAKAAAPAEKPAQSEAETLLENVLPAESNELGFMGLKDGEILAYAQTNIRVKGTSSTTFTLSVNGHDIAASRVGKKAVLAEKQLQAWEYIGIDLQAGVNVLSLSQFDQFGNPRGNKVIKLIAPGSLAKVVIDYPPSLSGGAVADGRTVAKVLVRLTDNNGVPVTTRTAVTLTASLGRWNVEDLNAAEPGIQTFIEGGRAEYLIMPPTEPGQADIVVTAGVVKGESKLDFLPDLRDMIAAGLIEGVLNLRKLDAKGLVPARAQDGFEQEITHLSRNWRDGQLTGSARTAMFLKGKVKGEYLLTMSYDSDKNTRDRLFRDIQPDEFYPIYGDSSVRGFDAQSTGRFYVRIDNRKSYLLYGDYNTTQTSEARKLSNYNRSLTGIKQHFENAKVSGNVFASRDSTSQVVNEFAANGTSGPFTLSNIRGLVNSEKVEILTRDRNQTAVVISAVAQTRFVDYELEPLTGRLLFKSSIPSLDEKLNPISIRVTYEVDQGGAEFWVAGADAQVKLTDRLEVGAMFVDDQNPVNKFRMAGLNATAKLADKTFLIAELAQTRRELFADGLSGGAKQGMSERIEFKQQGDKIETSVFAGKAAANFDNTSSNLSSGRMEAGGKLAYRIDDKNRLNAEALHTEDTVAGAKRDGLVVTAEHQFENGLRVEAGLRHARDTQAGASVAPGGGIAPAEVTSVRTRVGGDVPGVKGASAYGEAEVDVQDSTRKVVAVGGEYKLPNSGRLYARHEFISSLTGPFGLNSQQRQNSTVIGVNTDYMKDGNLFSEYRVRDAISGGDAEAAMGLRNTWTLAEGIKLQTGFEKVHALSGAGDTESTAATFGLEYTANPIWKGSARLELRDGKTSDSILSTFAVASKLNKDWTFLGRNTYSQLRNKNGQSGENVQDRMQAGLAYRDTDSDVLSGLARIEHRTENDTTQPDIVLKRTVELFSLNANWQPRRPFTLAARYAAKWTRDDSNGIGSRTNAQLVSGRAIWEFAPRWDVSLNASTMFGHGAQSKYYGAGIELGYMVMENLWVSAGYNFFGYSDADLTTGEYTNKGAFLRLRYKFDEDLFSGAKSARPTATNAGADEKSSPAIATGTK